MAEVWQKNVQWIPSAVLNRLELLRIVTASDSLMSVVNALNNHLHLYSMVAKHGLCTSINICAAAVGNHLLFPDLADRF